jgi:uncharacterized protein
MHNQLDKSTRICGMWCHLAALAGFAIPFGSIFGPLVVWLTQKDEHSFINDQGKESLNFQISMVIYAILLFLVYLIANLFILRSLLYSNILAATGGIMIIIIIYLLALLALTGWSFSVIMTIVAAVKAYKGQFYRYPFNLRFLR